MFYSLEAIKLLDRDQLVLTKCPEWCQEGFQVATWNGKEFEYAGQPNDDFNSFVTEFMLLSEDGEIESLDD